MRAPMGSRIRRQRQQVGITQSRLAEMVGISPSYLNLIENSKREVGGALLLRIADHLKMNLDDLSGERERKTLQTLEGVLDDPVLHDLKTDRIDLRELVARSPEAAQVLIRLHRVGSEARAEVEAFASRMADDPYLTQMLHQGLNRLTAMRSGAEILSSVEDLGESDRKRFSTAIRREAEDLSETMRALVSYFDRAMVRRRSISPLREIEDAVIAANNHFPALELLAERLRGELPEQLTEAALVEHLGRRFGLVVERAAEGGEGAGFNMAEPARLDVEAGMLWLRASAPLATRIFRMCRVIAELSAPEVLAGVVEALDLSTEAARRLGRRAVASYVAGAMVMPYSPFRAAAEMHGYDVDLLGHLFGASFEQAAHRLVTLRRPGAEGVPFGFLRADPAGRLTKRFPLPGLGLPGGGHGCVLWPIYSAGSSPGVLRQTVEFPNGARFLMVAKSVPKRVATWAERPLSSTVMLACDVHHAEQTVYARGLDLDDRAALLPVGPSCLLCPRQQCGHRQETASETIG